jgi:hypothetical protein
MLLRASEICTVPFEGFCLCRMPFCLSHARQKVDSIALPAEDISPPSTIDLARASGTLA